MKITNLIKPLFLTNDKFSITGLGTFITKPKSAIIDKKNGQITPPTKDVIFDTKAEQNDTVLRDMLLNSGLSEEQASIEIAKFVDEVKKALNNNDNYQLSDIGFFYKNNQGNIDFSTSTATSLLPEAAGFNNIPLQSIDKKQITPTTKTRKQPKTKSVKTPKVKKEKKEKVKSTKTPKIKKEKVTKTKQAKQPKVKTATQKEKSKKLVRSFLIIIPIVIILGLLAVFYKPIFNQGKKLISSSKDSTENISNNNTITNVSADTNLNNQLGNDAQYKKLLNSNITNTAEVNLGKKYKEFYIIVGSFSTVKNAEQYSKQLRNRGYSPLIIDGTGQRYFRVALGSYDNADKLIKDYTSFSKKYGKELWILVNKK